MDKTVEGLLEHQKKMVANKVQYVYGCKMEILTTDKYRILKGMYGPLVWDSDVTKMGRMCSDCSGAISSYTGIIRNSTAYKNTATAIATIAQLKANWKDYIGWGIWMNGHIGVVSDTEGYYYAMDGSNRNAIHYPLSKQNWEYTIKLKDIDYTANTSVATVNNLISAAESGIDVYYRVYAASTWFDEIANYNTTSADGYAGSKGKPVHCVMARLNTGQIKSRVHIKDGNWLPWVDGYNPSDHMNGYAGDGAKEIDAVQFSLSGLDAYDVYYRVSTSLSDVYLPWVKNTEDYAGILGKCIDKIQLYVKKKNI